MEVSLTMEILLVEEALMFGEMTAWSKVMFCELGRTSELALAWTGENKSAKKEKTLACAKNGRESDTKRVKTRISVNMFTRALPDPVPTFDTIFRPWQETGSCFLLLISVKVNFYSGNFSKIWLCIAKSAILYLHLLLYAFARDGQPSFAP
jgi:hypothetical protein